MAKKAKKFTTTNNKGGVLKSTITANLGFYLAQKGFKVLLIDLDAQGSLTSLLGVKNPKDTVYEALKEDGVLKPIEARENLWLAPADIHLAAAEIELTTRIGRENVLKNALKPLEKKFDFIFIDTTPSVGLLKTNALAACDYVLIPTDSAALAIHGIKQLKEHVIDRVKKHINPKIKIGGFIITKYNKRRVIDRGVAESLHESFGKKVFQTRIRTNTDTNEAAGAGKTIFEYSPKSNGAIDFTSLGEEFIKRFL